MALKAEFIISARDHTREAIEGAKARLESLDRTAQMLRYAFTGYVFAEFMRGVIDTDIKLQSMRYTLEAATGSMAGARSEMAFLAQTADRLGLSINDVGQYYARMAAIATSSGYSLKEFHNEFVNISSGMRVLHLDAKHTKYAWLAIQEIMAQGVVKMRHLTRQLSVDFPTALQAAAYGMHKTTGQLLEMAHAGTLASHEFLKGLSRGLHAFYGPELGQATKGLQADLARVSNAFTEAVNAADQSGKFSAFQQALAELTATIKDPAFISAFGEFIAGLGHLADWVAKSGEHTVQFFDKAAHSINQFVLSSAGLQQPSSAQSLANKFGLSELQKKLGDAQEKLRDFQHEAKQSYNYDVSGFSGQSIIAPPDKGALKDQIATLKQAIEIRKNLIHWFGPDLGGHKKGKHPVVEHFTQAQTAALKSLSALETQVQQKLQKTKTYAQLAAEALAHFKPGTKGYSEASALVKILMQDKAALDKVNAARERQKNLLREVNAEQRKQAQYVTALQKDAEHWKNALAPMRKVREEAKRLTEEYQRGMLTWSQFMAAMKKNQGESQKVFGSMNQYAIQAARNMQSAFAQFLYDPFKGGLRGMLKSFSDTLRKMVAQWLAAQALMAAGNALKGKGGWEGKLGAMLYSMGKGSGQAYGGPVYAGNVYPVGENGPELFAPTQNGTIIPNHAMGPGVSTTVNIDARGAGPDEVSKLLAMREGLVQEVEARVRHFHRYGHFPA